MSRLNVEIIHPQNTDVNAALAEIERKFRGRPATAEVISDMEREAARLIRRLVTTKVTFIR